MLKSSIDLGTNTCLLLIADWDPLKSEVNQVLGDHATIVRLGQGVDQSREMAPEAMERTLRCLRGYAEKVRQAGVDPGSTISVATSQARDARNGGEFFSRVESETGFRFRTISGEDEAKYTFLGGLLPGMASNTSAVIDIGGGSTELMAESGGQSVDLGSVRFTERFFKSDPVTDEQFWACQEVIDDQLQKLQGWRAQLPAQVGLVAVAGTATTLASWHLELAHFDSLRIDGALLTRGDVHHMVEGLKWRSVEERCALPSIEKGRADVILAGALILWRTMEILDFRDCRISTRGLRFGVLRMPDA